MAKVQQKSEKIKHFPDYFLTKAPPRHEETEAALTSVSLFSSLGNWHPYPGEYSKTKKMDNACFFQEIVVYLQRECAKLYNFCGKGSKSKNK